MFVGLVLGACSRTSPQALGTLEYDRITLPAPAAERIVAIDAHAGERVKAGQLLVKLNPAQTLAALAAAEAQARQASEVLRELEVGPRKEDIAKARASLAAAQAEARQTHADYSRVLALSGKGYVSKSYLDSARAAAGNADRPGRCGARRARRVTAWQPARGHRRRPRPRWRRRRPRPRRSACCSASWIWWRRATATVDNIPYKLGDQAPVGAPLAILLVGDAPYARIYVPEPERAHVQVGDVLTVHVDGVAQPLRGRVRLVRDEPVFTPYYALSGDDAARLSYIAEVQLGKDAAKLPVGLPLHADLPRGAQ